MKFLVDAQLPKLLAIRLREWGHTAYHTLELEGGNRTPDGEVASFADAREAVLVSKDLDFLHSHLLEGSPVRLLLVCTGNISNRQLLAVFEKNLELVVEAVRRSRLVELNQAGIILRDA
ncbi:MAG: DUF5615 family PIN-like protein [Oceanipulchritudo sp.]